MRNILITATCLLTSGCMVADTSWADRAEQTLSSWPLKTTTRPPMLVSGSDWVAGKVIGSCPDGIGCPYEGQDLSFATNWYAVDVITRYDSTAGVTHYSYEAVLPYNSWPSPASWPTLIYLDHAGTGAWAGDSFYTETAIVATPDTKAVGDGGATMANLTTVIPLVRDSANGHQQMDDFVYRILPAGTYITGTVQCKKANGTNHPSLVAIIKENGTTDRVKFRAGPWTVTNTGSYCPISRNGTIINQPVSVTVESI